MNERRFGGRRWAVVFMDKNARSVVLNDFWYPIQLALFVALPVVVAPELVFLQAGRVYSGGLDLAGLLRRPSDRLL
jgi:hypothetical protein